MCHNNPQWTKVLPTVLLGLRSTFREEFQTTPSKLVYGSNIRLPSDFLHETQASTDISTFAGQLTKYFSQVRPAPPSRHGKSPIFVTKDLNTTSHVFVRTDAVRPPLQPPYEGPFKVLSRSKDYYTLSIKEKSRNISINRLKPCFIEQSADLKNNASSFSSMPTVGTPSVLPKIAASNIKKKRVTFSDEPPKKSFFNKTSRVGRPIKAPSKFLDSFE
ncbi:uncharacterized protein [Parasteatoda tepidariorum]|uniref:uncharacterized protein n=1 Tax=Parasteatoda tepidariorum TaxID=114398 RepID=UPI001C71BD57|nr:uncharacterized protein LOC107444110 [Parasteatoda tepidariorum]